MTRRPRRNHTPAFKAKVALAIEATTAQVNAAEIALNGVREEARVGQRTTLDVLIAQQELVNARVARRRSTIASLQRTPCSRPLGGLSMQHLGLNVLIYDPMVHYQQIRDAWVGLRNPMADNGTCVCRGW